MSRRRDVEKRIASLKEIHSIMDSMKNLAMIETRKLARFHELQQEAVAAITHALNDVRYHFAPDLPGEDAPPVYLLFGSERGFCGAYNQRLLELLRKQPGNDGAPLIGVGSRLAGPLRLAYPEAICLPGAAVADEVDAVLASVFVNLNRLRQEWGPLRLEVIHFQPDDHEARCQSALPSLDTVSDQGLPPLINLPLQELLSALLEHYLFAVAHAWFFAALMAENQRRTQHLDQAGHHLEQKVEGLEKRRNALRQEEIIEEIEVILLSAEGVCLPGIETEQV